MAGGLRGVRRAEVEGVGVELRDMVKAAGCRGGGLEVRCGLCGFCGL